MRTRANLSKALGQIVKDISQGRGTVESYDSLMEDFVECKDFMDYFKAIWYLRLGSWITALKTMPIASLESSAPLEFYHNQLKIRFLNNETDSDIYKRADWLVNKLSTKIHSYFWLDEYEGKNGFSRYWKDECATDFNAWRKSRTIPNTDVITEGERVKVVDQYSRCLINMLKCPPANSLIRDDAVSLAVWVNEQLSAQFAKSAENGVSGHLEVAKPNSCKGRALLGLRLCGGGFKPIGLVSQKVRNHGDPKRYSRTPSAKVTKKFMTGVRIKYEKIDKNELYNKVNILTITKWPSVRANCKYLQEVDDNDVVVDKDENEDPKVDDEDR
nr:zinc ion binding protein [Tanacetum cinerariifolium]